jgi:hypothetical protein
MHKEKTRTGHAFIGNEFYVITTHHTLTLNMVNGLILEILYIIYYKRKESVEGDDLQEQKYCNEGIRD